MKVILSATLIVLTFAGTTGAIDPKAGTPATEASRRATASRNAFALELLARGAEASGRHDLAVAPVGLLGLLALVREGASGETASQIDKVLGLDPGATGGGDPTSSAPGQATRTVLALGTINNGGYGVKVIDARAGSPAEKAGIRAGDLIFAVDGAPVKSVAKLNEAIAKAGPSGSARLQVYHAGSGLVAEHAVAVETVRDETPGMTSARSAWIQTGSTISAPFREKAARTYRAELFEADFRGDPGSARSAIARWLGPSSEAPELDPDTRLLLLDRFALRAPWSRPFPEAEPGPFRTIDGKEVTVPFLRLQSTFPTSTGPGFEMIEVPFADGLRSMRIVLPSDPGVSPESIAAAAIDAAGGALKPAFVDLAFPKFTIRRSSRLDADLGAMGMPRAFSREAELPGIDPKEPLKIGAVRQSVLVEVDEVGARAEATTGVAVAAVRGERREPRKFRADRPFLFLVAERSTGLILLAGCKYR